MKNIIASAILVALSTAALAQSTGTAKFNGTISEQCVLSNFVDGTIVINTTSNQFSSAGTGGSPAYFAVATTGNAFRLVFGTPTLTGPSGVITGATFSINPSVTRQGGGAAGAGGNQVTLGAPGNYLVQVNVEATLQSREAGTYTLQVPASCAK